MEYGIRWQRKATTTQDGSGGEQTLEVRDEEDRLIYTSTWTGTAPVYMYEAFLLIAAAPELLQAARGALADLEGLQHDDCFSETDDDGNLTPQAETIQELTAAIEKAQGA